jgi:hypothetical protein
MKLVQRVIGRMTGVLQGPPARERTVVRVVRAEESARFKPGFIIGVYRSGTTLLRFVLDSHSRIAVPPESNFLVSLADLCASEWNRKGLLGVGVDEASLLERVRDFAWRVFDDYTLAKGKQRWFDKTPSYVDILPFLDRLFGAETRYLMLYRHGLDVAASLTRMHGDHRKSGPARRHAADYPDDTAPVAFTRYWADRCRTMLEFEASHPGQCLRIRYEDYAAGPGQHLPRLFEFLGEPWEPQVLRFSEAPHDHGLQDSKILETRGFVPSVNNYRDWAAADLEGAWALAAPVLDRLGYDTSRGP